MEWQKYIMPALMCAVSGIAATFGHLVMDAQGRAARLEAQYIAIQRDLTRIADALDKKGK